MGDLLHLNFANALLPMAVLIGLSIAVPALVAGDTTSQRRLTVAMLATAVLVWVTGAAIMALLYAGVNAGELGGAWRYFERSGLMGLLWVPVLGLVWLIRAQGVERRRGLVMGRGSDETSH